MILKNYQFKISTNFFIFCLDLHCSSEDDEADDDDMMEEVKGDYDELSVITQEAAAEAMMQLGNFSYYSSLGNSTGSGIYRD